MINTPIEAGKCIVTSSSGTKAEDLKFWSSLSVGLSTFNRVMIVSLASFQAPRLNAIKALSVG